MTVKYADIAVDLISSMGDDKTIVDSARVSFDETGELKDRDLSDRDKKLLRFLIKNKHTSTLEHCYITFRVNCPLFVRSHIMRHRTFSYNEVSRRYTSKNIYKFYRPDHLRSQSMKDLQCSEGELSDFILEAVMRETIENSLQTYQTLIEGGVAREQARMVLPQSQFTSFWMSGNLNNFIKFLVLRLDSHTQQETREVAVGIRDHLSGLYPLTFSFLYELGVIDQTSPTE